MARSRITEAVSTGLLTLPDGLILVVGAPRGTDLSALDGREVIHLTRLKPDYDYWQASGAEVTTTLPNEAALSIFFLPRAKSVAQDMLPRLMTCTNGPVVIDGQKVDGVDSLFRRLKKTAEVAGSVSLAHGRLFVLPQGVTLAAPEKTKAQMPEGFITAPGVFSEGKIDPASRLLAENLPPIRGRVADFGAGWGYLSRAILTQETVLSLDLVEADAVALDCARQNVSDPRAAFLWEDVITFKPGAPYDAIVMNPPFHQGRAAESALGQAFIQAAARALTPRGVLWLVANRHLPYETTLNELFRDVTECAGTPGFKLIMARNPKQVSRPLR